MNEIIQLLTFFLLLISCDKENVYTPDMGLTPDEYIHAVDISSYPEISVSNPIFYDLHGNAGSFLSILKENAVNTIRLRLWVNPAHGHSGFDQVKQFSEQLKSMGFKIWLTLHYSDTWADPSQQIPPQAWQGIDFSTLKTNVYHYTQKVTQEIQPNYLQIGNELNTGFLHPYGHITHNFSQFIALMETGIAAVRENTNNTSIIIHYAGFENANWFYDQVSNLDYDIIGLSYYPKWHGKSIHKLSMELQSLGSTHQKKVLIAETAYPFTLDWNDMTNNVVGLEEHLILPAFPATKEGQKKFIKQIKTVTYESAYGLGFCYWGAELIAWKGRQSEQGSSWENQALFDFDNKALPVLEVFN